MAEILAATWPLLLATLVTLAAMRLFAVRNRGGDGGGAEPGVSIGCGEPWRVGWFDDASDDGGGDGGGGD
ncbi:MAG: hypothetical protein V2I65_18375 [Paracoccaceae bacterium]|jgi:hypothetical protein|nr:hypothetical protein [Paracoccaceae bacterium]